MSNRRTQKQAKVKNPEPYGVSSPETKLMPQAWQSMRGMPIFLVENDELEKLHQDLKDATFYVQSPLWFKAFCDRCLDAKSKCPVKIPIHEMAKTYHQLVLGTNPERELILGCPHFSPEEWKHPENAFLKDLCQFLLGTTLKGNPPTIITELTRKVNTKEYRSILRTEPEKWKALDWLRTILQVIETKFLFGPEDPDFKDTAEKIIQDLGATFQIRKVLLDG